MPKRRTGVVIGPGGETASSIRRTARCQLHVRKEVRPDDTQAVEVSGTAAQVRMCACRGEEGAFQLHTTRGCVFPQVTAGVERVREILLNEDKDMPVVIPRDGFSYIDVLPEMVGYVLGTRSESWQFSVLAPFLSGWC